MIPITELLLRFRNIKNTEKSKKEMICREIKETTGIIIEHKQVVFSKNIIMLKVKPIIKTEIFLKKEELMKRIKSIQEVSYFSDIM